jgi:cell wall-associated NlpC family hydrolase/transcriptional regulator with XRE-family HTH domain
MPNVRTLRLTRDLTLTELALLVGIPARTLAEIEYGLRPLAPDSRRSLARIYDLQPDVLEAGRPGQLDDPRVPLAQILGSMLVAGIWLTGTLALTTPPAAERPAIGATSPVTAVQARMARLSSARPRGRALLPTAARNPTPRRRGVHQPLQQDDVALINARQPAPQSTAAAQRPSDVAPAASAAAPTSPAEAPAPPAPAAVPTTVSTEAPSAPTEAPTSPAEASAAPAPAEATAAPADTPALSESNARGNDVAAFAMQFVGAPYVWGGADPDGFDCSGFTQYVYRQFGLDLPHFAADQYSEQYGTIITDPNALQPGDLVFFANTYEPGITHIGIYIANGDVVQAMSPGIGVAIGNVREDYWAQHYYGALRPLR